MKYFATLAAAALILAPSTASASPALNINTASSPLKLQITTLHSPEISIKTKEAPKPKAPEQKPAAAPAPVVYEVVSGDNLSKIGSQHNVEWQRLFAKNLQIEHPDRIDVGWKITIPAAEEQLSREIPAAVSLPAVTPGVEPVRAPEAVRSAPVQPRASGSYDSSNTYDYGYCTWYVKNRRGASLPNMLGNANTWYSRAAAMGMSVGSVPAAGAVGTTTRGSLGHVVYVESVNGDGSINISEMNAPTFGVTTYRTAAASEFVYIY